MKDSHSSRQTPSFSRRQFLYYSALAAVSATTFPSLAKPHPRQLGSNQKLRIACVGAGGKGRSDIKHCSGEEIVAICDADQNRAADALKACPNARFYFD